MWHSKRLNFSISCKTRDNRYFKKQKQKLENLKYKLDYSKLLHSAYDKREATWLDLYITTGDHQSWVVFLLKNALGF